MKVSVYHRDAERAGALALVAVCGFEPVEGGGVA